jgi:hypothetical protein
MMIGEKVPMNQMIFIVVVMLISLFNVVSDPDKP